MINVNEEEKKEFQKSEQTDEDIVGKKFEDLTCEEMQKIQGSGDVQGEDIGKITTLILSKPPYNCR